MKWIAAAAAIDPCTVSDEKEEEQYASVWFHGMLQPPREREKESRPRNVK
jgi:hypothetical protein